MKLLSFALLAVLASVLVAESVIDYSKLPDCAHQCAVLDQAEKNCVPPAAPVTDQGIYQSCLCQSALLTTLHSSGTLCQQFCSTDDANKISQYYVALCNGPVVQPPAATTIATTTRASTSTSAKGTATAGAAGGTPVSTSPKSDWFSTHWKWVVMVIVIFLAIVFFWVGGIYLRRHFDRKREAARANMAAQNAPHNPPTPGGSKYTPSKNESTPQMAMSGARNGVPVASPARPGPMRSRSSTLQSVGLRNSSRTSIPQPVVWGPHQHLAHANSATNNGSPAASVPPSPTSAITPVFRNRESMRSEPRFSHHRGSVNYNSAQGAPGHVNSTPSVSTENIDRPRTALEDALADRIQDKRRTLTAVKSDPALHPVEAQTAEICEPSPHKLQKPQKH